MARQRIKQLTLTKFRGSCQSTTFEFDDKKDIVLIFGENGTGKSSIADALDFICNNDFGSLKDRSGTSDYKHIVALNALPRDLEVVLKYGDNQWYAKLQGQKPKTSPDRQPRAFILRRADITRVMEAAPRHRYEALQAYITVPNVERAEAELRGAYKEAQKSLDRAVSERSSADDALERYWQAEGRSDGNAYKWAQRKVSEDTSRLETRLDAANQLLTCFDQTIRLYAGLQDAQERVNEAGSAVDEVTHNLQAAVATMTNQSEVLVALLESALNYLQIMPTQEQTCPICGKSEDRAVLLHRVQHDLEQLVEVKDLVEMRALRQIALTQAKGALTNIHAQFVQQCHELTTQLPLAAKTLAKDVDLDPLSRVGDESELVDGMGKVLEHLTLNRPALQQAIQEVQKTLHQRTAIKSHLQTIDVANQDMQVKQSIAERLKAMLGIVERERKAYLGNLLRTIAKEVNDLYVRIHPDEPLGGSTLTVKKHTSASLELKANFGNATAVVPGAYYSEAHLDTLGLCVYLALAKHSRASNNIVVLDNILTSVDEVHLGRIVELLVDEAPNFGHLIITTHSRAWFNHLRTAKGMNADLFELHDWNLTNGIRHSRSPRLIEELR